MNGKTLAEMPDFPACPNLQTRGEFRIENETDGVDAKGVNIKTKNNFVWFIGGKNLGSCGRANVFKKEILSDDCKDVALSVSSANITHNGIELENSKTYSLEKLSYKGIVDDKSSKDNIWHEAGNIEFEKDGWAGTITYAGSKVNPTYDAWANLEMISGVLAPADGE